MPPSDVPDVSPAPPSFLTPPAIRQARRKAQLATLHVTMISIGGIIGAGLFVGTSATISAAGPGVMLSYVAAGVVVWLVMQLLGLLAISARGRGSFVSHIARILGPRAAFMTGWAYAFLWAVTAGAQAVAGGLVVHALCAIPPLWAALGFIALAWAVNRMALRYYGHAETGLSALKLIFLACFIIGGVAWVACSAHPFQQVAGNIFDHGGILPLGLWAVVAAIPMIMQSFAGCEISVIAATDSERPLRSIVRTMRRLPLYMLFFFAGSVMVILALLPWNDVQPGSSPFLEVMQRLGLPFAAGGAATVTLLAVLSCLNSSVYVVARVLEELSACQLAPAWLQHRAGGQRLWATRLTTLLEVLIVLWAAGSPKGAYPLLLGASGGLILFVYFMVALAAWRAGIGKYWGSVTTALLFTVVVLMFFLPSTRLEACLSLGLVGGLGLVARLCVPARQATCVK
ncbi:amino acid permease [Oecophyllibacter saccharovorans]|uniref:amino acid permease n=1 Tax=Oecophyllibacter saccharovorans TaxID=2558360 RepID=UPI001174C2D0|nr:amino acid permease [Oecophyllibacter saccharovorans]TPW35157.1 amino acid permease [Oecophyllibacter saccharovorans]